MHIPDGYLDPLTSTLLYILSIIFVGLSIRRARTSLKDEHIPLLAMFTAAVFAAQMINWPIGPGGTTAHLIGSALLAILLGIGGGTISMTVLLSIQAFFFGDGGVTTLGANIWNMGVIGCLVSWLIYSSTCKLIGDTYKAKTIGSFLAGWIAPTASAFFCGLEIGLSPQFPYGPTVSIPLMTGYHFLLGFVEGLVTSIVIGYILKSRPDILKLPPIGLL